MSRPVVPQRDLFGRPAAKARDCSPVVLPMREISAGTDAAWHLAPKGMSSAKAAFAPRQLVERGSGDLYTMPRWVAAERGWL